MSRIELRINTSLSSDRIRVRVEQVVAKATVELEAATKVRIVEVGAVDTGHMLGSVAGDSTGLNGRVTVGANYSRWVHDGHHLIAWGHDTHRYIPGRPFLRGPLEEARPRFLEQLAMAVA